MMKALLQTLVAALVITSWQGQGLHAQGSTYHPLGEGLPGHPDTTYADLAGLLFPDLAAAPSGLAGSESISMRHIGGAAYGDVTVQGSFSLSTANVLPLDLGMPDRIVLLFDLPLEADGAENFAALGLFDISGKPRLLDAVNVSFDRMTGFPDAARFALGHGANLILTTSSHFNSGQGYATTALILAQDDKFSSIDTISTFDENLCAFERRQVPAIVVTPFVTGPGDIVATVTETTSLHDEDCGADTPPPAAGVRKISVTYHWDASQKRYKPDSDAFAFLARENEERF